MEDAEARELKQRHKVDAHFDELAARLQHRSVVSSCQTGLCLQVCWVVRRSALQEPLLIVIVIKTISIAQSTVQTAARALNIVNERYTLSQTE